MSIHSLELTTTYKLATTVGPGFGCALHGDHGSVQPMRLVRHHVFPQYLQIQVYGEVLDDTRADVCDTGHAGVHVMEQRMVKVLRAANTTEPEKLRQSAFEAWTYAEHRPFREEWKCALDGVYKWINAAHSRSVAKAHGPFSCDPTEWRCARCGGGQLSTPAGWSHRCGR